MNSQSKDPKKIKKSEEYIGSICTEVIVKGTNHNQKYKFPLNALLEGMIMDLTDFLLFKKTSYKIKIHSGNAH